MRAGDGSAPDAGGQKARPDPILWTAIAAAAGPSLLAFNLPPSPTFLNQALALALWGLFVAAAGGRWRAAGPAWPLWAALGGVALGVFVSWGPGALPASLALAALGLLLAAPLLAALAWGGRWAWAQAGGAAGQPGAVGAGAAGGGGGAGRQRRGGARRADRAHGLRRLLHRLGGGRRAERGDRAAAGVCARAAGR